MKVLKYEIQNVRDQWQELKLPTGSLVLKLQGIGSHVCLWVQVPNDSTQIYGDKTLPIYLASTGVELPEDVGGNARTRYFDSIIQDNGQRVLHAYFKYPEYFKYSEVR